MGQNRLTCSLCLACMPDMYCGGCGVPAELRFTQLVGHCGKLSGPSRSGDVGDGVLRSSAGRGLVSRACGHVTNRVCC
ncbi:hypothetical protein BDV19DRAFT_366179 [Aspergillus venezuelensis]